MTGQHLSVPYAGAAALHEAFEQGRFLDAWRLAQPLIHETLSDLSMEDTLLATRLSWSLGGHLHSRRFFRRAEQKDPNHPLVRLFRPSYRPGRFDQIEALREFEARPHLDSGSLDTDNQWLAMHAMAYAQFRDFERARQVLARLAEHDADAPWLILGQASLLLQEDKPQEALLRAEAAWRRKPAFGAFARLYLSCAARVGRDQEAAQAIINWIEAGGQAGHVLMQAMLMICRRLERLQPEESAAEAAVCDRWAERLPAMLPLADKWTARIMAAVQCETAKLCRDRPRFMDLAAKAKLPYYDNLVEAYTRQPDGERLLLPHVPLRQNHNTCFPSAIAAALHTQGIPVDQDAVAAEITYDGTEARFAAAWARNNGLAFLPFFADRDSFMALIRMDMPCVMTFHQAGGMGHAVTVVGYDEATDAVIYHDPGSPILGEQPLPALIAQNLPNGPLCFVVAPPDQEAAIRTRGLHRAAAAQAYLAFTETLATQAATTTWQAAETFRLNFGDDPVSVWVAIQTTMMQGHYQSARDAVIDAFVRYPQSRTLMDLYLHALSRCGDGHAYERTLQAAFDGLPLPGLPEEVRAPWTSHIAARLAQLLFQSEASREEAERCLRIGLRIDPTATALLTVKVDERYRAADYAAAAFYSRLTTTLNPTQTELTTEYAWLLRKLGRQTEAIDGLAALALRFCKPAGGTHGWITAVQTAMLFGEPNRALALLETALARRPRDGDLWSYATLFYGDQGLHDEAVLAWQNTQQHCLGALQARTGFTHFFRLGDYDRAAPFLEAWLTEAPDDMGARDMKQQFVLRTQGAKAAARLPAAWHRANTESNNLRWFDLQHTERNEADREQALRAWLEQQPRDNTARRVLVATLLQRAREASTAQRPAVLKRAEEAVAALWRDDAAHPHTRYLKGACARERGQEDAAIEIFADLLCDFPDQVTALHQLTRLYQKKHRSQRWAFLETVQRCFDRCRHDFETAAPAAFAVEALIGLKAANQELARQRQQRPNDPHIAEALIDLNIQRGEGVRSLEAVKDLLADMVARYPRHIGFKRSLMDYYRWTQQQDQVEHLYAGLIQQYPTDIEMRIGMARCLQQQQRLAEAEQHLQAAARFHPYDPDCQVQVVNTLVDLQRTDRAADHLAAALERLPRAPELHQVHIERLLEAGEYGKAEAAIDRLPATLEEPLVALRLQAHLTQHTGLNAHPDRIVTLHEAIAKQDPGDWEATRYLVFHHISAKRSDKARALLKRCRAFNRDEIDIDITETILDFNDGKCRRALEDLARLLERDAGAMFGWQTALKWIEQENAFEIGHDLLLFLDEELTQREDLATVRAHLAGILGIKSAEILQFWETLHRAFPHSGALIHPYVMWCYRNNEIARARELMPTLKRLSPSPAIIQRFELWLAAEPGGAESLRDHLKRTLSDGAAVGTLDDLYYMFNKMQNAFTLRPLIHHILADTAAGHVYHQHLYRVFAEYSYEHRWVGVAKRLINAVKPLDVPWRGNIIGACLAAINEAGDPGLALAWVDEHHTAFQNDAEFIADACRLALTHGAYDKVVTWSRDWEKRAWPTGEVGYFRLAALVVTLNEGAKWFKIADHAETLLELYPHEKSNAHAAFYYMVALLAREEYDLFQTAWERFHTLVDAQQRDNYRILELFYEWLTDKDGARRRDHHDTFLMLIGPDVAQAKTLNDAWHRLYQRDQPPWRRWLDRLFSFFR